MHYLKILYVNLCSTSYKIFFFQIFFLRRAIVKKIKITFFR